MLEVHKLSQENDLLSQRLAAINLRTKHELHLASASGGSKADEVHLRQELDERSHQCTVLLRERLQLEQCIRHALHDYCAWQQASGPRKTWQIVLP